MLSQRSKETSHSEAVLDGALFGLAFCLAFALRTRLDLPVFVLPVEQQHLAPHLTIALLAIPTFWILAGRVGLYEPLRSKGYFEIAWLVARSIALTGLLLGTTIFVLKVAVFSRAIFLLFLAFAFALILGAKLVLRFSATRAPVPGGSLSKVLIVGTGPQALDIRRRLETRPEYHLDVVGHVTGPSETGAPSEMAVLGSVHDLSGLVEQRVIDDVIFAVPVSDLAACARHVAWCEEVGVNVHFEIDFVRALVGRAHATTIDGIPMLTISSTPRDPIALVVKRLVDVTIAAAALALASPLLALIALAVRVDSSGPSLFRQRRTGLNGREFTLLKFRTMVLGAEDRRQELERHNELDGPAFKMRQDPRVTSFGRFLRASSLDELPQLWNVLVGDMSLVGPRPLPTHELRRVERWQRRRQSMKPGLTCLWQISGRSDVGFEQWMRLDLLYIDTWSLKLDLAILLRTLPAVMMARGAR